MAAVLHHRGPDDQGVWQSPDAKVSLAHRRLSILDLSPLGRNPMAWGDGKLRITFNGEIYNFLELRRELQQVGHVFRSQTDTEVVLAAYDQWDVECVQRFAGMFAFALWDARRHRLWLVRDRLGKKPLYYTDYGGSLRFASELKAILIDESVPREIDPEGLRLYMRYGYVPSPVTIFRHIRKLPPAHFLTCENGSFAIHRYWDPLDHVGAFATLSEEDAEAELEHRLATAVSQRRLADVPLGAFLSGGIDSSLIVSIMQEQSSSPVRTFTIAFEDPSLNEGIYASAVAAHLGTDHHEQVCRESDMLEIVERLPTFFDEPFADSSAVPTYLVSKIARQHVTVALSGDGGDELFFGYPRYLYHSMSHWVFALPSAMRTTAAGMASYLPTRRLRRIADVLRSNDPDRYSRFVSWWRPEQVATLLHEPSPDGFLYGDMLDRTGKLSRDERAPLLDLVSYLPEDILTKVDRTSMAVSLEVRAPLLDHRLVELAVGLPITLKRRRRTTKWILNKLLYKRVPRSLVDRPKLGFGVPIGDWMRGPLRERMEVYVNGQDLEELGMNPAPVRQLWKDFLANRSHRTDLLWHVHSLVAWSRDFKPINSTCLPSSVA
jgi:asparagine synthase (glutamine-hydrolysing)